ncbi:MAG: universal stress protein [Fulvivirga sp.]
MVEAQLFKKILYPTDFSNKSLQGLNYVLKLSEINNAELILLHAYRLLGAGASTENLVAAKKMVEDNANLAFQKLDSDLLKDSQIRYSFISEVGFLSDRIVSNIKLYEIDLVVLCTEMQKTIIEKSDHEYKSLVNALSCPLMLMP